MCLCLDRMPLSQAPVRANCLASLNAIREELDTVASTADQSHSDGDEELLQYIQQLADSDDQQPLDVMVNVSSAAGMALRVTADAYCPSDGGSISATDVETDDERDQQNNFAHSEIHASAQYLAKNGNSFIGTHTSPGPTSPLVRGSGWDSCNTTNNQEYDLHTGG